MKKYYIFFCLLLFTVVKMFGVVKHERYISSGQDNMFSYYGSWVPGSAPTGGTEDENFFISRVKPMKRFVYQPTQVIQDSKTEQRSKRKLLWWCPIGENEWTSLPRYAFDSEAFSSWSYLDIHGNWTQGFLRQPGAFADVCHKNGVSTACVSAAPWAVGLTPTDGTHGQNYQALINGGADKLMKLFKYYGIDGLGFNSEQDWGTLRTNMKTLINSCQTKKTMYDIPLLHFDFYNLSDQLSNGGGGTDFSDFWPAANGFFLNYNWNSAKISYSIANAGSGSSYDIYAGMDMQGRSYAQWSLLDANPISVGIWGAHNKNMPYESAGDMGSASSAIQYRYLQKCEQLFTGGTRNPVNDLPITSLLTDGTRTDFHGVAKLIAAKSALSWTTNGYFPFVTYFNLGNGKFLKDQGEITYDNEWYNIGVQDHLPTWRWWITNSFMGRTTGDIPANFKAGLTYEDAWFGGSCLEIKGESGASSYVHLFKTQFLLNSSTKYNLTIRYKVLAGTAASMSWACAVEGTSVNTPLEKQIAASLSETNGWVSKTIAVQQTGPANYTAISGKTLALMALKFVNTSSDFDILIGEVSLKTEQTYTPATPQVTLSKVLKTTSRGVDFKVVFKSPTPTGHPSLTTGNEYIPVYNSEVSTWYFEIWAEQTGKTPQLVTVTSSWAAYAVEVPIDPNGTMSMRFGVRAVAPDGITKSTLVWSATQDCSNITILEGFSVDKPVIKPNENFTISFDDVNHGNAVYFKFLEAKTGAYVAGKTFNNVKTFTTSLTNLGLYDVEVQYVNQQGQTVTEIRRGMIQVSGPEVGALPQIYTLTTDKEAVGNEVSANETVTFSYTGRPADGSTSRALTLVEKPFCVSIQSIYDAVPGLSFNSTDLTISCWFAPTAFIPAGDAAGNTGFGDNGTQMLNIRNPSANYPASDWGYVWSGIHNGGNDYWLNILKSPQIAGSNYTTMTSNFVIPTEKWTHLAVTINATTKRVSLFINGRLVSDRVQNEGGVASVSVNDFIFMGGPAKFRSGFFGAIDEFQIWKKGFTASTVNQTMQHYNEGQVPADLIGYWDFEQEQDENAYLLSRGSVPTLKAFVANAWTLKGNTLGYPNSPDHVTNRMPASWTAGTPFLSGIYQVVTTPSWNFTGGATAGVVTGNGVSGNTTASWASMTGAPYKATLTLSNSWGKDMKSVNIIDARVKLEDGKIVETLAVYPNPFAEEVHVKFADAGNYDIEVLSLDGKMVQSGKLNVATGEVVRMSVTGEKGLYLVRIKTEGKVIQTVKINKK